MALPKFSDLSTGVQITVILVVGAGLWGATEYLALQPVRAANETKQQRVSTLEGEVAPLRPFRERVRALEADNRQLENQLANLQRIVPNEKEVDDFVRLIQTEASTAGVLVRRITAQAPVTQQYYVEVPFEMELDGPYYDVLQFYDRLGRVERITNVADLQLGGVMATGGGGGRYDYSANTTVTATTKVTTFFSREEEADTGTAPAGGQPTAQARPTAAGR
jgi:type IV pilus assembly protein PilO